jgi:hypothetical protein
MMERFRVGLTALALIVSGVGHGRADYVLVGQFDSPGNGDGRYSDFQGVAVVPSGNIVANPLTRRIHVFTDQRLFLTSFGYLGDGGAKDVKTSGLILQLPATAGELTNHRTRHFSSDILLLNELGSLGIGSVQCADLSGVDLALTGGLLVDDSIDRSGESSTRTDPVLAKLGGSGSREAPFSETTRVFARSPGNGIVANPKVILSLILLALAVLGTLGYSWRRRRRRRHRALRGPRRTATYRSPSLPDPRGTS